MLKSNQYIKREKLVVDQPDPSSGLSVHSEIARARARARV